MAHSSPCECAVQGCLQPRVPDAWPACPPAFEIALPTLLAASDALLETRERPSKALFFAVSAALFAASVLTLRVPLGRRNASRECRSTARDAARDIGARCEGEIEGD